MFHSSIYPVSCCLLLVKSRQCTSICWLENTRSHISSHAFNAIQRNFSHGLTVVLSRSPQNMKLWSQRWTILHQFMWLRQVVPLKILAATSWSAQKCFVFLLLVDFEVKQLSFGWDRSRKQMPCLCHHQSLWCLSVLVMTVCACKTRGWGANLSCTQ